MRRALGESILSALFGKIKGITDYLPEYFHFNETTKWLSSADSMRMDNHNRLHTVAL